MINRPDSYLKILWILYHFIRDEWGFWVDPPFVLLWDSSTRKPSEIFLIIFVGFYGWNVRNRTVFVVPEN